MPSTDQTYCNIKRLHFWLSGGALALLAVTVWMLAADHCRPWRQYQRTFRDQVEPWLTAAQIVAERTREYSASKAQARHVAALEQTLARQRPSLGKRLLSLPLLDAFGRTLAIDQIWLPELTIDYNFARVARCDRCTTCHQGIDRDGPGGVAQAVLSRQQTLTVELATPKQSPPPSGEEQASARPRQLESLYGLGLADAGVLDPAAPTVGLLLPKTPAADARLAVGDVVLKVNQSPVACRDDVYRHLLEQVEWGKALKLEIRRGLPQPYTSHPRLDLFLGAGSPHPTAEFGCTICHDGQGSATAFAWASHAPDDPAQRARWQRQYGWFSNRHWDLPMLAGRFAQSRCLKCHHEVTDLEPSRRFPDPPAEKLLAGYHLVGQMGCFGCHEIKGFDAAGRPIGPDMRLESNDASAAGRASSGAGPPPGTMRKVGPSLRDIADRVDEAFLADWIGDPTHFLPSARMPTIYGMYEQLDGQSLRDAQRFEAVEIRAAVAYLLSASRSVGPLPSPAGVTEPPSAARGKRLLEIRGCLACHQHHDFPAGKGTQGPDLSRVGAKYAAPSGADWLVGWIRNPLSYAPRTRMPVVPLEPTPWTEEGAPQDAGKERGKMTDPAADIAAYLLAGAGRQATWGEATWGLSRFSPSENGTVPLQNAVVWQPRDLPPLVESDLDELALLHLGRTFPRELAQQYLQEGIPESLAQRAQDDTAVLKGGSSRQKKLLYVGRRTIGKRGCYGCHDIAGFESAPLIGPALSDWGRKQPSLLAFDQINQFLRASQKGTVPFSLGENRDSPPTADALAGLATRDAPARLAAAGTAAPEADADRGFFLEALVARRREGFLWQKLRVPRSFDYQTARHKGYNEWLTMGRFPLSAQQREAIMTFVLGLLAEPPAEQYVYRAGPRRQAVAAGRKVLDKYACGECHALQMERWTFQFDPTRFAAPPPTVDYEFLEPDIPPEQLAASRRTDLCGLASAEVEGMPRLDAAGRILEDEDDEGHPLCFFTLWEPAAIGGRVWRVGGAEVTVPQAQITRRRPPLGGTLARLLYPVVLGEARAAGFNGAEAEAWGWVPPSLVHEGAAVQPAWLYDYLLAPYLVRPAAVLRMPRYNISPEEAGKLVDYFAAVSGVDFPYSAGAARRAGTLQDPSRRLDEAFRLLLDRTMYCAKCHLIGDDTPEGGLATILAPNLDQTQRRSRPQYLRRWLASPKSVLPYTPMPVNFPPTGEPLGQDLFPGSSLEQLDAVMDLLLDYNQYARWRASTPRVAPPRRPE